MALETGTKEAEITAAIEKIVGGRRINVWTIGTTDNIELRREAHGRPTIWHYWHADTEAIAKKVEKHFRDLGMKGFTGTSGENAHNVYITW
jgi:hypothetical protein